jgi:hypothetical protein
MCGGVKNDNGFCKRVKLCFLKSAREVFAVKRIVLSVLILLFLASGFSLSACSKSFWGGAAAGTVGTGAVYEYKTKQQMDRLEKDFEKGDISKDEYLKRKKEIEKGSIIY